MWVSNDTKLTISARNGKTNRRYILVFGGSDGFAAVSSQFLFIIFNFYMLY